MVTAKHGRSATALAMLLLTCTALCNAGPTDASSLFAELTRLVGDRVIPDIGDFRDCSRTPIALLDDHVVEEQTHWFSTSPFTWATVVIDGGTCVYLEKPERRGLTSAEAKLLMSAASHRIELPVDEPAPNCPKPDILDVDAERTEDSRRGKGFTYGVSYVEAKGALVPFHRVQREFVARQKAQFAGLVKNSPEQSALGKRMLGVSFDLSRSGDFASMTANISFTFASETRGIDSATVRTFAGWLLHKPSGRILTFDDLFVDPHAMRELILAKARPRMSARFKQIYVHERTEVERRRTEAAIDRRILHVTDPARSAGWQVTLDRIDPCEPGLLVTFDDAWLTPHIMERPEARFSSAGIRPLLKPEFRDAFGARTEKIPVEPPFSSETVARQFPALMEASSQHLLPLAELQPDLVDCPKESPEVLEANASAERSQWMYNGLYRWRLGVQGEGTCVVLFYPEQRGLSLEEAWALLSAAKRKLPFDESKLDPGFAFEYPIDTAQSFGGFPTFERGSVDGIDYAIGFMGIDASLQPLEIIQRRSAQAEIAATAEQALHHRPGDGSDTLSTKLRMDFISGGRTAELTVLAAQGTRSFADGQTIHFTESWMLHVPSGKLIGFDDLFVDPAAMRKRISEGYRREMPSQMGFHAFLGEDRDKQAAAFRDAYRRAAYRVSAPTREHFRDVRFRADPVYPGLLVFFSNEALPEGDYAFGGATFKSIRPHLKPKYLHAFDPAGSPQPGVVGGP